MKLYLFFGFTIWLTAIGSGTFFLNSYQNTPQAVPVAAPLSFPAAARVERDLQQPTLIFFAHPHCPCTKASLRELARLMTRAQNRLSVHVFFVSPKDAPFEWAQTDSFKETQTIPGVNVSIDENAEQAELFGAHSSGTALVYDADGSLRFSGGITPARGMEGDNAGKNAIVDLALRNNADFTETSIYGCPLTEKDKCQKEHGVANDGESNE